MSIRLDKLAGRAASYTKAPRGQRRPLSIFPLSCRFLLYNRLLREGRRQQPERRHEETRSDGKLAEPLAFRGLLRAALHGRRLRAPGDRAELRVAARHRYCPGDLLPAAGGLPGLRAACPLAAGTSP